MNKTNKIIIKSSDKTYSLIIHRSMALSELLCQIDIQGVSFPCGGNGLCGKCLVQLDDSVSYPPTEADIQLLSRDMLKAGYRLGCMLVVQPGKKLSIELHWLEERANIVTTFPDDIVFTLPLEHTYGCAVDIGTTTIVVYFIDRSNGEILGTSSAMNNQRRFGGDVISRIQYSNEHEEGLEELHQEIVKQIKEMIGDLTKKLQVDSNRINEVVVVGNPTVIHLLIRKDPSSIAHAPFALQYTGPSTMDGMLLGVGNAQIVLPGLVSAYIGSDITAGILASKLTDETGPTLFIDIGTNGEIILWDGSCLYGCSSAAGPAFEGATIFFGMSASEGAIDHVWVDENGSVAYSVIGERQPKGICGSAIIECVALMKELRLIDETGALVVDQHQSKRYLIETDQGLAFQLSEKIYFTGRDVREVQLAKAAIAAGIDTLLAEASLSISDIESIKVAGGFGSFIHTKHAQTIGLLPAIPSEKVHLLGNTAGKGAIVLLNTIDGTKQVEQIRTAIEYIELSDSECFQEQFVEHLFL